MKLGLGICYYGGMHPRHAYCLREVLKDSIPVFEIHGGAYPEMNYAEITREALDTGTDVVVITENHMLFTPEHVREYAKAAYETDSVVSPLGDEYYLDFAAIPRTALERLATLETREYSNSSVIGTGFGDKLSRPFFSPWKKAPGTLDTPPIIDGQYCTPAQAFRKRLAEAGVEVDADYRSMYGVPETLGRAKITRRIANADEAGRRKRREWDVPDYAICVPCFGQLDRHQQRLLWEMEKWGMVIIELYNCPYIDVARAELTRLALDELGLPGLFFLDHDIYFQPRDVIGLMREAESRQDVVAAIYCMRKTAHSLIGAVDVSVGDEVGYFELGQVHPALYTGLGFAAIPRAVVDSLRGQYPALHFQGFQGPIHPLYALDVNGNFYSGEDASFCARVQGLAIRAIPGEVGEGTPNGIDWELKRTKPPTKHRVWVDTRIRIFHRGPYSYGVEDHSIAVPRVTQLVMKNVATRAEVREFLRSAAEFSPAIRERSIGCDADPNSPHGILPP